MSAVVKEVYDAFRSAGVTDELATAAAQSIPVFTDLATKADISDLRAEVSSLNAKLGAEIGSLDAKLGAEIGSLDAKLGAEIGSVRAEMKHLELRMTIKLYSALGVAVAGIKALDFLIG